jgi:Rieske Fe-S protein
MSISRRQALVSTGITVAASTIAGCATYGKPPAEAKAATVQPIVSTAEIPVGSGLIVDDVVITQPAQGQFKAFSAVCTHAGCTVAEVLGASIICPCHGSSFNLDGTVAKGPANRPLDAKPIVVQGDSIALA